MGWNANMPMAKVLCYKMEIRVIGITFRKGLCLIWQVSIISQVLNQVERER